MPLVYSYNSNKGRKEKNEDAISVSKNKQGAVIAVVCDGVGSHSNAAYSSNYIVATLEKEWHDLTFANFNNMKNWLYEKIEQLNKELFEKSQRKNKKMGTTIVTVGIFDNQVVVATSQVLGVGVDGLQHKYQTIMILDPVDKDSGEYDDYRQLLWRITGSRQQHNVNVIEFYFKGE